MAKTEYERYIRTQELFALLRDPNMLVAQDEILFQVTHQTSELWMRVALNDVESAVELLEQDQVTRATELFSRVARIEQHLARQLELLELMPPKTFVKLRSTPGRGSIQDSPGMAAMMRIGEVIWPHVLELLERRTMGLVEILYDPERHVELHALLRALFELDQWFQTWRFAHARLADRTLGGDEDSQKGARQHLMPELWAAVNDLRRRVSAESGRPSLY